MGKPRADRLRPTNNTRFNMPDAGFLSAITVGAQKAAFISVSKLVNRADRLLLAQKRIILK